MILHVPVKYSYISRDSHRTKFSQRGAKFEIINKMLNATLSFRKYK